MGGEMKRQSIEELKLQVGRICAGEGEFQDITKVKGFDPLSPAELAVNPQFANVPVPGAASDEPPLTFGRWLRDQEAKSEEMFLLISAAKRDPHFPLDGNVDQVRARLRTCSAEGDLFDALDEAELEWAKVDPSIPF